MTAAEGQPAVLHQELTARGYGRESLAKDRAHVAEEVHQSTAVDIDGGPGAEPVVFSVVDFEATVGWYAGCGWVSQRHLKSLDEEVSKELGRIQNWFGGAEICTNDVGRGALLGCRDVSY